MRVLVAFLVAALFITLPLALVTHNATLLLSPAFVGYEYRQLGLADRLPATERRLALDVVEYLRSSGRLGSSFSEREIAHLKDVRRVFWLVFAVRRTAASALAAVLLLLILVPGARPRLPGYLLAASLLTVGLMGLVLAVASLDFDWLFSRFHSLFFVGDSWLFPETALIIRLFPAAFWVNAGLGLAILTMGEALLLAGLFWLVRSWRSQKFRQLDASAAR